MTRVVNRSGWLPLLCLVLAAAWSAPLAADAPSGTPADLVATYSAAADAILALNRTEEHVVKSILSTTYGHAMSQAAKARAAMKAGDAAGAKTAVESVAAFVSQLGTEGDSAVSAVRKRLLEGGHHHNAQGEAQGIFDEGFVVVTKAAKAAFLESSKAIGSMAAAPSEAKLDAELKKVETTYKSIMK